MFASSSWEAVVPRWVVWAARAVPLAVLPSGVGFAAHDWWLALFVVAEGLALLTLGLVRPWGEVLPRWVPLVGGRSVPTMVAVGVSALGAVAVTFLTFSGALVWNRVDAPHGVAGVLMAACYAPLLAWGPLLAVVTVAYYLRRRVSPSPTGGTGRS
ncbi:hypothetical protein [Spirillospora sp. CA-294931]|uniref:hypothetical protein n=1 Tax=Spirillospora sp. CA-294931 TaxID=3240042 RepID=UPI003D91E90A